MLKKLPSFEQLLVLSSIAETSSMVGASSVLGIPKSTVGRRLSELENLLGTTLVIRSTRHLCLSSDGEYFLKKFEKLINEVKATLNEIDSGDFLSGQNIRISSPVSYGHYILYPMLEQFLQENEEIEIQVLLENQGQEIVKEGYDIAIVIGDLKDSSLIAQQLAPIEFAIVKSPLLHCGSRLDSIEQLAGVPTIGLSNRKKEIEWRFEDSPTEVIALQPAITVNDFGFLKELTIQGKGVSCLPTYMIQNELRRGDLEVVLEKMHPSKKSVHVVYHSRTLITSKLRQLISHFKDYNENHFAELSTPNISVSS